MDNPLFIEGLRKQQSEADMPLQEIAGVEHLALGSHLDTFARIVEDMGTQGVVTTRFFLGVHESQEGQAFTLMMTAVAHDPGTSDEVDAHSLMFSLHPSECYALCS